MKIYICSNCSKHYKSSWFEFSDENGMPICLDCIIKNLNKVKNNNVVSKEKETKFFIKILVDKTRRKMK